MNSEEVFNNSETEEQEPPKTENVLIKKKGAGRYTKEVKPLNEIEIKQRREALEIARKKKKGYSVKEQQLKEKEEALLLKEKQIEEQKALEPKIDEPKQEDKPKKEPKTKKKVQRIVEISESDSEEEELVYVKKPKQRSGVAQADYMDMVKQTNAEMLRKQLESERVRLAMMSCFPNMKF